MQTRSIAAAVVTLSAFLFACSSQPNTPAPASTGQAEALFSLNTGGDQMTETSRQAGLVVTGRVSELGLVTVVPVQDGVAGVVPRIVDMKFRQPAEVPTTMPR
jgi:hypothetical protein